MVATGSSVFTFLFMAISHLMIVQGQPFSTPRAIGVSGVNRTEYKRVLTDQLGELHTELLKIQRSTNQSMQGDSDASGTLYAVAQKVDAMLLTAMPGFVGETIDIVRNSQPGLSLGRAFGDASDYGLLATVREASDHAKKTVQSFPTNFLKSLGTLEKISYALSPSAAVLGATKTYRGCRDAFVRGETKSGVYNIQINRSPRFRAWCDFDDTGAWTVIQRRFDGSVDFCRSWNTYVNGFGSLWGEHWLGLRAIHQLSQGGVRMSIYMEDIDRQSHWMNYSSFYINGADDGYRLYVSGYSGGIYNALSTNNGYRFATRDRGSDGCGGNSCAPNRCSGWWYACCSLIEPNSRYEGIGLSADYFMSFYTTSYWYRLTTIVMRISV